MNFLRKNEYIDCNLETLDKSTLLTDMDRYGSDEVSNNYCLVHLLYIDLNFYLRMITFNYLSVWELWRLLISIEIMKLSKLADH